MTGLLGLPPCNGLIPQSPLHTKSLLIKKSMLQQQLKSHCISHHSSSSITDNNNMANTITNITDHTINECNIASANVNSNNSNNMNKTKLSDVKVSNNESESQDLSLQNHRHRCYGHGIGIMPTTSDAKSSVSINATATAAGAVSDSHINTPDNTQTHTAIQLITTTAAALAAVTAADNINCTNNDELTAAAAAADRELVIIGVYEQRISNLTQSVLIGVMCTYPFLQLLNLIPTSVLSGLFLYMGIASFYDNQFATRMMLIVTENNLRKSKFEFFKKLKFNIIIKFSLIQLLLCLLIYGITFTKASMIFPVFIGVLVPIRLYILPR